MNDIPNTFWVRGYTADGFQVSVTLAVDPKNLAQWITDAMSAIRAGGIQPREQGTEPGELTDTLFAVIRRSKLNEDGSETPVVDFYNEHFEFKVLHVYLNTKDDVQAFEDATGLALGSIPYCDRDAALSRSNRAYSQYAVSAKTRAQFVYRKNPKWDDSKTPAENKTHKHLFVRWLNTGAPAPVPAPAAESRTEQLAREIDEERAEYLKPGKPVLTDRQFIASSIQKKAKNGKEWYVLLSEDGSTFATTWGLSEYGVFSEKECSDLDDFEEHEIDRVMVTWKPNKDFKNVTAMLRLPSESQDIPF